jgi:hypothetical protein
MGIAKSMTPAVIVGACLFFALNFVAKRSSLDYHISNLVGRLDDPYGFQNLALPRLLRLLAIVTPSILATYVVYQLLRFGTGQFSMSSLLGGMALVAVLVGLGIGDSSEAVNRPIRAATVVAYSIALTGILAWFAMQRYVPKQ